MRKHRVRIAAERNGGILMSQHFRKRPYVHATLERASGKGMSKGVKAFMRQLKLTHYMMVNVR